jgi:hypothetical protein
MLRFCAQSAEVQGMPDTLTTRMIPRPIAVVLEYHSELQTAYIRLRAQRERNEAFVGAVSSVLSESDVHDLSDLIAGSYDGGYDARRGAEFGQLLLDDLEQSFQAVHRIRQQGERWRELDTIGLVEALTTDADLARLFVQTLDERDETTARAIVSSAVRAIVEKASITNTSAGTRRALEAAARVFRRHATDADDAALAAWCEALDVEVSRVL